MRLMTLLAGHSLGMALFEIMSNTACRILCLASLTVALIVGCSVSSMMIDMKVDHLTKMLSK